MSCHKGSCHGCFGRMGAQGSAISAFNFVAACSHVLCRYGFSSSVCQVAVSIYNKGLLTELERMGRLVCLRGCTKQCHFCPKLAIFLIHLFRIGLACYVVAIIYHSAISAFLEPHCHHKASNHPIISNECIIFIYSAPSCKHSDPWVIKGLLSLLDSWVPVSSVNNFKPVGKIATFFALVTAKCCSDLTVLGIDNQHLFLQHHGFIFVPASPSKIHLKFVLNLIPVFIFALYFI